MSETREYLYTLRPVRPGMLSGGPTPAEAETVAAHFAYLKDLGDRGVVLLAGRTLGDDDRVFGVVIFREASDDRAKDVMDNDPAVRRGVMRAELHPYRIAVVGKGLGQVP